MSTAGEYRYALPEAAIAMRCSTRTLFRYLQRRVFPGALKVAGKVLIPALSLENFIKKQPEGRQMTCRHEMEREAYADAVVAMVACICAFLCCLALGLWIVSNVPLSQI